MRLAVEVKEIERSISELEASKSGFLYKYCGLVSKRLQLELYEKEIVFRIKVLSSNK